MPIFHHSVAVLPLPFFRSVAAVAVVGENGNAGNVFRIHRDEVTRTLIGCPPTAERQLAKNRIRSYCYGTAVTAQRQVETATGQQIFFT